MVASQSIILSAGENLSHAEACRLAERAAKGAARSVVLDMSACCSASTAAFARLVILRRELLQAGRDIRLAGLQGRPARLFEVHRLESVLPQLTNLPASAPAPRRHHSRPATALATAC
jgi:anti-anti-sigma regulatory factor